MGEAEVGDVIGKIREEGRRGAVVESQFPALGGGVKGDGGGSGGGDHQKGGGGGGEGDRRKRRLRKRIRELPFFISGFGFGSF